MGEQEPLGRSFGEVLRTLAEADPDRPAVTCGAATLTRRELDECSNVLARDFAARGVVPGAFVTLGLPNDIDFLVTAVATWKLGATPQPVSARLPRRELDAILALVDPALVVGIEVPGRVSLAAGHRPPPDVSRAALPPAVAPAWKAPTSGGSTGRPKVIVAGQPATLEAVCGLAPLLGLQPDGTMLTTAPLFHNGPFLTSALGLLLGMHVVVMPCFDPAQALELVGRHRVQWMYAVPTMMLRIWRLPVAVRTNADLSSLQRVLHTAAPCPQWLKQAWIDWLGPERVWEVYGGTEVQALTAISGEDWLQHPGSVGPAVVGEICILDEQEGPVPPGQVGWLWMRRGPEAPAPYRYLGAEARRRAGGWECLGDMGWMDEQGYVYLTDRDCDLILVGGANVYPAEVEAVLEEHPAVGTSCVVGMPDDDLGQVVHAVVQTARDVSDEELLAFCAERLLGYKMPRVVHRSDLPLRDETGKLRRSGVRERLLVAEQAR